VFEIRLNSINQFNSWCGFCSNPPQKLCENNDCKSCFENSFASHEKSKYLHDKTINPRTLFKNTHNKFLFNCDKCNHIFETALYKIQCNRWCGFCSNPPKKLCEDNECKSCFEKSFASHEKSKYWDIEKNNGIMPRYIFKFSGNKHWINCNKCYQTFETRIGHVTFYNSIGCPYCLNKTEQMLFDKLVLYYPLLKRQYKKDWCKKINYLPFDFVIEYLKIIIELDGDQHFEQISNWLSPEKTQENDLYKMKCANENGFSVIRILQQDVYYNKYDWLDELMKNIEMLKADNVINIYMCKGNEYDCFNSIKSGL
jgi:very-short-patch-repair endonuclease